MGQGRWASYLTKHTCAHSVTISTVYAGLERKVCENCGHVSIRYLSNAVKIFAEEDAVDLADEEIEAPTQRTVFCHRCHLVAEYMTPTGLACSVHAWGAASMQVARLGDMWIPIRIDPYETYDLD